MSGSNGSFEIKAGKPVFLQGHEVSSVNILAKGKLDVYISATDDSKDMDENQLAENGYKLFSIDQNMFIGANDLFLSGRHSLSYKASMDSIIFSYHVNNIEGIEELFSQKNEYSSYILNSITSLIEDSHNSLKKLERFVSSLEIVTDNLCLFFWILKEKHGLSYEPSLSALRDSLYRLKELKEEGILLPGSFNEEFLKCSHSEYDYAPSTEVDALKLKYYEHMHDLDPELMKQLLNESFVISQYTCTDSALLLKDILGNISETIDVADKYIKLLYDEKQPSVLGEYLKAAAYMENSIHEPMDMIETLQYLFKAIKNIVDISTNEYCHTPEINVKSIKNKIDAAISTLKHKVSNSSLISEVNAVAEGIPEELKNSTEKILDYSGLPKERCSLFINLLSMFRGLKDKLSEDEQARHLRSSITKGFFEIYEAVLKKAAVENNQDMLIHLFLTYGYMDEKLMSQKNLWTLYNLNQGTGEGYSQVYTMGSWLRLIYEKKINPSVNDFSMDYFDTFREMKKHGEVQDSDKVAYENSSDKRLSFEINNMFKQNHRLCSRSIRTYFPILCDESIVMELDKALVTPQKLEEAVRKVLAVDFSAFHREISYFNMKKGIEKEFILQAVYPDIILMPIYGSNAIMWQEISGRVRNTPGRFIIPAFTEGDINEMLQKLIGEFRWELCKTMMGTAWNDVSLRSLTSEYTDYIQFYKKNKELSEESKEKLTLQVKKYRNITRQIFASDYITWLNYESNGILRLNKLARDILYRHCPFPKETRERLLNHPSFAETANLFRNKRAKQVKDLENRYARYVEKGIVPEKEMLDTLDFYKNL